jgi:hypothetical protein
MSCVFYPPVVLSLPTQQLQFVVSPQYGHTQVHSSMKLPHFSHVGLFSSVSISFASS